MYVYNYFCSQYEPQIRMDSAPFRSITVKDSMSDLPDIKNGSSSREMSYMENHIVIFNVWYVGGLTNKYIYM